MSNMKTQTDRPVINTERIGPGQNKSHSVLASGRNTGENGKLAQNVDKANLRPSYPEHPGNRHGKPVENPAPPLGHPDFQPMYY